MRRLVLCCSLSFLVLVLCSTAGQGRRYDRCQLAQELYQRFKFPKDEIAMWICIAYWEGNFDTSPVSKNRFDASTDFGMFQINDKYWCVSDRGRSMNICNMTCDRLLDDDLADDVQCAREIVKRQGLRAWVSYRHICYGNTHGYLDGCTFQEPVDVHRRMYPAAEPSGLRRSIVVPAISIPKPEPVGLHLDLSPKETQVQFGGPHGINGHVRVQPFFQVTKFLGNMGLGALDAKFNFDDDDD